MLIVLFIVVIVITLLIIVGILTVITTKIGIIMTTYNNETNEIKNITVMKTLLIVI